MRNEKITSKKVKVIGTQQYINADTGEIENFHVTSLQDRDFNFTKVWLNSVLSTLNMLGNKKSKVAYHIIDNLNKENQYIGTQRQIAERAEVGLNTVNTTLNALLKADFLRVVSNGVYCINPDMLFKGNRTTRLNILQQYNKASSPNISDEEKIANLEKVIDTAQKAIQKLKYKAIPEIKKDGVA